MAAVFLRSVYCMVFLKMTLRVLLWPVVWIGTRCQEVTKWETENHRASTGLGPRGRWHRGPLAAVWRYWFFSLPVLSDSSEVGMVWSLLLCAREEKLSWWTLSLPKSDISNQTRWTGSTYRTRETSWLLWQRGPLQVHSNRIGRACLQFTATS